MASGARTLARLDAIAAALIDRALPTTFRVATSPADVATAQRLRGQAMLEQGWARPDQLMDGREEDADDERAQHVLAFRDGSPVGTCRLVFPEEGRLLPMERAAGAGRVPEVAVELGRVVVIHPVARHQRSVMAGLVARAWREARARGHCRICGLVSAPILRLYRRMGFLVRVVGPPVRSFGEERYPILFAPEAALAALTERYGER